jgi:hypothetical protein
MKRISIALFSFILFVSCGSVKKTETAINEGSYDQAIDISVKKLIDGKNSKRNQEYIPLLERAYKKAVAQDQIILQRLQLDPNPYALEPLYKCYLRMDRRQNNIRPLLPLRLQEEDREARFTFQDYGAKIIDSRTTLSDYLLSNSKAALKNATTLESRNVYQDLKYLDKINPNFKNTRVLLANALEAGTHYIFVDLNNKSQTVLPKRLEEELLNFSTYGMKVIWTQFHTKRDYSLVYDYRLEIIINRIFISPEQVTQKELIKEKQIKDGFIYEYDSNNNVKKDSLGNDIKKDKLVTIKAHVIQNTQLKETEISAVVQLKDNRTLQIEDRFPVNSNYVFTYIYGAVYGDKRALDEDYLETINLKAVVFPSNEKMIYDTGEDLKIKIKQIINNLNYN